MYTFLKKCFEDLWLFILVLISISNINSFFSVIYFEFITYVYFNNRNVYKRFSLRYIFCLRLEGIKELPALITGVCAYRFREEGNKSFILGLDETSLLFYRKGGREVEEKHSELEVNPRGR